MAQAIPKNEQVYDYLQKKYNCLFDKIDTGDLFEVNGHVEYGVLCSIRVKPRPIYIVINDLDHSFVFKKFIDAKNDFFLPILDDLAVFPPSLIMDDGTGRKPEIKVFFDNKNYSRHVKLIGIYKDDQMRFIKKRLI